MAAPETKGRMLNQDISESKNFAKLSPPAAVLFCMIIPHLNSYGKLKGGVGFIKDEVCPLIPYITERKLPRLLQEIDANTNVKWFKWEGRDWIHSINFLSEHQTLRVDRMGEDKLPDYSRTTPGPSPGPSPARARKEEVEEKKKGEGKSGTNPPKILEGFKPKGLQDVQRKYGFSYATVSLETKKFIEHVRASGKEPVNPQAAWELWMLRQWEFVGGKTKTTQEQIRQEEEARQERADQLRREQIEAEANAAPTEEALAAIERMKALAGAGKTAPPDEPPTITEDDIPW